MFSGYRLISLDNLAARSRNEHATTDRMLLALRLAREKKLEDWRVRWAVRGPLFLGRPKALQRSHSA